MKKVLKKIFKMLFILILFLAIAKFETIETTKNNDIKNAKIQRIINIDSKN